VGRIPLAPHQAAGGLPARGRLTSDAGAGVTRQDRQPVVVEETNNPVQAAHFPQQLQSISADGCGHLQIPLGVFRLLLHHQNQLGPSRPAMLVSPVIRSGVYQRTHSSGWTHFVAWARPARQKLQLWLDQHRDQPAPDGGADHQAGHRVLHVYKGTPTSCSRFWEATSCGGGGLHRRRRLKPANCVAQPGATSVWPVPDAPTLRNWGAGPGANSPFGIGARVAYTTLRWSSACTMLQAGHGAGG
jgi:hypothetical protein